MTEKTQTLKTFDLIVGDAEGNIENGDVPVRWCITPELVQEMDDKGMEDLHVLVASVDLSTDTIMDYQLVPLTEMMTYVRFTKAGDHVLIAWIIDGKDGRAAIKNEFHKRENWKRQLTVFVHVDDDDPVRDHHLTVGGGSLSVVPSTHISDRGYARAIQNVNIPAEAFGKEPPQWIEWYANLWHDTKAVDQCAFRRRLMIAFTLKPILFAIVVIALMALRVGYAAIIASAGWWRLPKYTAIPRVFSSPSLKYGILRGEDLEIENNGWYATKLWKSSNGKTFDQFFFTPLATIPLFMFSIIGLMALGSYFLAPSHFVLSDIVIISAHIWSALFTVALLLDVAVFLVVRATILSNGSFFVWTERDDTYLTEKDLWRPLMFSGLGIGVAVAIALSIAYFWAFVFIAFAVVIVGMYFFVYTMLQRWMDARVKANDYTQVRELLCPRDPENLLADYDHIPKSQRSVRLWVKDVKNKVCKPMQL